MINLDILEKSIIIVIIDFFNSLKLNINMSSIPSPISAFKNWKEYEPNPPNIGVNTNNNTGIILLHLLS